MGKIRYRYGLQCALSTRVELLQMMRSKYDIKAGSCVGRLSDRGNVLSDGGGGAFDLKSSI